MSAIVTSNGKIVYYDSKIVTFDLATKIASVDPNPDRTVTVDAEVRTVAVPAEDRTVTA